MRYYLEFAMPRRRHFVVVDADIFAIPDNKSLSLGGAAAVTAMQFYTLWGYRILNLQMSLLL